MDRERDRETERGSWGGEGGGGERQRDTTTGIHDNHSERDPWEHCIGTKEERKKKGGAEGTGADGRRVGYVKCKRPAVRG